MKILVVNAGSSSLKYQVIDMTTEEALCSGGIERIGIPGTKITHKANGEKAVIMQDLANHTDALDEVIKLLLDEKLGVISSLDEISAVGHRYVNAGEEILQPTLITDEVLAKLEKNVSFAPVHDPAHIACIKSCKTLLPNVPSVIVLDTGFHATMPKKAYMYAIKYEDYEAYKVRRYGAHGTSHRFVSQEAIKYLKEHNLPYENIVTCHLGNGSSISAVKNGECIDTSMGMTPLAGIPMGTRSGDVDVSAAAALADKKGLTFAQTVTYLNKECGYLGVSGVSSDSRDLYEAKGKGNERAALALDIFVYDTQKYIGSYAAAMNGLDCIVFTGGIGENAWESREAITDNMDFFGVKIDKDFNRTIRGKFADLTAKDGKVRVLVIPTNEELVIARQTKAIVEKL